MHTDDIHVIYFVALAVRREEEKRGAIAFPLVGCRGQCPDTPYPDMILFFCSTWVPHPHFYFGNLKIFFPSLCTLCLFLFARVAWRAAPLRSLKHLIFFPLFFRLSLVSHARSLIHCDCQ